MPNRDSKLLAALTTIVVAYGCGGSKAASQPLKAPIARHPTVKLAQQVSPKPDDDASRGTINVSQDIRIACGLADDDAHFAFDSSRVIEKDRRMLRTLADCFVSGPLKGRNMTLIGHADPRGSEDYNLALGGRRADNVKVIMVAETMIGSKVSTTSRGDMDATGTDEASWANDRRVDVYLGNQL